MFSQEGSKIIDRFAKNEILKEFSLDEALQKWNCKALYTLGEKVRILGNRAFEDENGEIKVIIIMR